MIKFFNNIRLQLAEDGKPLKYLRYAIGEIVLVVIGILIALQINNWNEARSTKIKIRQYLTLLIQDLKEDQNVFNFTGAYHIFRIHSGIYLLKQFDKAHEPVLLPDNNKVPEWPNAGVWAWNGPVPDGYDPEFIVKGLIWLFRYQPTPANKITIDEFKALGLFSQIGNQDLKTRILEYYSNVEWTFDKTVDDSNLTDLWNKSLVNCAIGWLDLSQLENPIEVIFTDKSRVAILKNMIDESVYINSQKDFLLGFNEQLIEAIETELKR